MALNDLIYGLDKVIQGPGSLGVGQISNESKVRFVISNAGMSNLVRVRAKINNQPNWVTLADLVGSVNQLVDVYTYDYLEVIVLTYSSLSDRIIVTAASFDGASISITTPGGDIPDANSVNFTSEDGSVVITADPVTGNIDFQAVGGGGSSSNYEQSFVVSDWSGPDGGGDYFISVPLATHAKTDPLVQVFEADLQIYAELTVETNSNVTISVPSSPDLRFNGKLIIS